MSNATKEYIFRVEMDPSDQTMEPALCHASCPALLAKGAEAYGRDRGEVIAILQGVMRQIVNEMAEQGETLPEGPRDQVTIKEWESASGSEDPHNVHVYINVPDWSGRAETIRCV